MGSPATVKRKEAMKMKKELYKAQAEAALGGSEYFTSA